MVPGEKRMVEHRRPNSKSLIALDLLSRSDWSLFRRKGVGQTRFVSDEVERVWLADGGRRGFRIAYG